MQDEKEDKRKSLPQLFKKGQSGNPSGRPKLEGAVRELARGYTQEAIQTLYEIMSNRKESAKARVAAANSILDRGWGRPPLDVEHGEAVQFVAFIPAPSNNVSEWQRLYAPKTTIQ